MPLLAVLKLESCGSITSASMAAIAHSNLLKVLELDDCSLLTSLSLDVSHMSNLQLVHCHLWTLNLTCLMLSSLTVLNFPALHRIIITSTALKARDHCLFCLALASGETFPLHMKLKKLEQHFLLMQ